MPQPFVTQAPILVVTSPLAAAPRVTLMNAQVVYLAPEPAGVTQMPILPIFPYEPDEPAALVPTWPVREQWEWRTAVSKGISGREQRMALRDEPFIAMQYDLTLLNDADRSRLMYTLHRYAGRRFNYPLWQYRTPLTAPSAQGATSLTFDPAKTNVRAGEKVALFNADLSTYFLATVATVTGTGVTLSDAGGLAQAVTTAFDLCPAPLMRVPDLGQLKMGTVFGSSSLLLTTVPPRSLKRPGQAATVASFDSLPLLPEQFLTQDGVTEQFNRDVVTTDTWQSDPYDFTSREFQQLVTTRSYVIDRDDMDYWRQFAFDIRGGREPFLLPSHRADFSLTATPSLGGTTLTAEGWVSNILANPGFRYLRLETANGVIYRKVIGALLNLDGSTTITLSSALGASAGDNTITRCSFMMKCRLAQDRIAFEHFINHTIVNFSAATVEA